VRAPTGRTHVAGVIGDPVAHSLSPALHNAAFAALGLDWVYVAFPVAAGRAAAAVAAVRALGLSGLSVTMPHKADVAAAVDRLTPTAATLGVVNTIVVSDGELLGDSTDGPGLVDALRADEGFDPDGCGCVVLGTGGAARAVTLALATAGARSVVVVGRRPHAAAACAALAGPAGRVGTVDEVTGADLVVNATPVGMDIPTIGEARHPALPLDLDADRLGAGQLVADLVYAPAVTPLLTVARHQGASAVNGLGMLLHQAGRQIEAWTGQPPPLDAMSAAALAVLGHEGHRRR
jgi:shikimate dehydrogenase